jgi:hypothetical protein
VVGGAGLEPRYACLVTMDEREGPRGPSCNICSTNLPCCLVRSL